MRIKHDYMNTVMFDTRDELEQIFNYNYNNMSLTITGKLLKILPVESGTSKEGKEWKKQNFVVDSYNQYNPEVCFNAFGDEKIKSLSNFKEGEEITVSFNLSSREFNGKYYHNIDAWRIEKSLGNPTVSAGDIVQKLEPSVIPASAPIDDDLPF